MKPEEKEMNPYQKSLLPFDPIVLIREAMRKWLVVAVFGLIAGMLAYVYTNSVYVPRYTTSCTLVLTTRGSSTTVYDSLRATSSLASMFTEILNSSVMRNRTLEELQMDSFDGQIEANAIAETNLMTVTVTAGDPRTAFRVMDVLMKNHSAVTYVVMGDIILEILEPPTVPMQPSNRVDAERAFKMASALSAAATFAMLLVLAYFRDVIRSKEEAEEKLDCWCLGEILHERKKRSLTDVLRRKKSSILITDPQTGFRYVTTMSKLRRRVEKHMHNGKVLMVTSVMENEGKSTVAVNLALALSKKYAKVLLVDCDLHKPACKKILEQEQLRYVAQDVIRGTVSLTEAVEPDRRSRMDVLYAKRSEAQESSDLVASAGMAALVEQARASYDYVVIDLPPMAVAPDSEAITELADASLLVIRQNGVQALDANRAIVDLQRGRAKLLGCVVNDVYTTGMMSGEGYGTGYGRYGRYGGYGRYGRYGRYAAYTSQSAEE